MDKTIFKIPKMDCPSEEQLIRLKLEPLTHIRHLDFDLPNRILTIYHQGSTQAIDTALQQLNLQAALTSSERATDFVAEDQQADRKLLLVVLLINFAFFVLEALTGFLSGSLGLVADSFDMLADALVYGLSLYAVGKTATFKNHVARLSGYFQILLAVWGFIEVLRRFFFVEETPNHLTMIIVSVFALAANAVCLVILNRSKSQEAHIQASKIFTSNDVIINCGVIAAGGLVYLFTSNKPDLLIGTVVFVVVMRGAIRILNLSTLSRA